MKMYILTATYILGVKEISEQLILMSEHELDPGDPEDEAVDAAVCELLERFRDKYHLDLEPDDLHWHWQESEEMPIPGWDEPDWGDALIA